MTMRYPVDLSPDDNDTILAVVPDVPGCVTFGADEAEALANAVDALEAMLSAIITDREDIPMASAAHGRPTISPTLLGALKIAAYQAMRECGWRKADLARALDLDPRQIDRLLDLRHKSTIAQLEQALAACGKAVEIETRALAEAI